MKTQLPFSSLIETHFAVVSTWPCTICPSNLAFGVMALSKFTVLPSFNAPMLDRSKVSLIAVTV